MMRAWLRGLANVFRRRELDARLDEEVEFHVDMQVERNIRSGMSPDDARHAALLQFGGRDRWKEETRDAAGARRAAARGHQGRSRTPCGATPDDAAPVCGLRGHIRKPADGDTAAGVDR